MTDPEIRAECPPCSGWSHPTGERTHIDGSWYLEMKCEDCGHVFDCWKKEWEEKGIIPPGES